MYEFSHLYRSKILLGPLHEDSATEQNLFETGLGGGKNVFSCMFIGAVKLLTCMTLRGTELERETVNPAVRLYFSYLTFELCALG